MSRRDDDKPAQGPRGGIGGAAERDQHATADRKAAVVRAKVASPPHRPLAEPPTSRARKSTDRRETDGATDRLTTDEALRTGARRFALLIAAIALLAAVVTALSTLVGFPLAVEPTRDLSTTAVVLGICAALWLAAGSEWVSRGAIRIWDGILFIFVAVVATAFDLHSVPYTDVFRPSWASVLVVLHPLLVPGRVRWHVSLSLLATIALPIGVAVHSVTTGFGPDVETTSIVVGVLASILPTIIGAAGALLLLGQQRRREQRLRDAHEKIRQAEKQLQHLGSYTVERKLGEGGMGEVWAGRHELLARPAAIKLIRTDLTDKWGEGTRGDLRREEARTRFEREAHVTASLTSPHTVRLFDYGEADPGVFFYAMELLKGLDIFTLVSEYGRQPQERVLHFLLQACDSLGEAHDNGLVHRDVKPENLYLTRQGLQYDFIKVLDFGLVLDRPFADDLPDDELGARLTRTGIAPGSPHTMAPEQAIARSDLDPRVDIYALGCVAYFLLTGAHVFEHDDAIQILLMHVNKEPVPPSKRVPDLAIDPELEQLVMSCLKKNRSARPPSMESIMHSLRMIRLPRRWSQDDARAWAETHKLFTADPRVPQDPDLSPKQARALTVRRRRVYRGDNGTIYEMEP